MQHTSSKLHYSVLIAFSLSIATLVATGCGTNAVTPISPQTQTAPAFVIGTDAPLPSVTSFAVQIQSINATTPDGTSVPLISGTPTVDFARFNGLQTLIDMNDVPVGTYTGITVILGSATLGYLNVSPNTAPTIATEAATLTSSTVTKTLTNPLVVTTSGPVGLRMDFDLRKSVQVDSNNQITGTVTPALDLKVVDPSDSGAYVDEFDAAVLSVNANAQSFTIQGPHGHQFTVNVNGQTMWDNNESLGDLSTSSIVEISGTLDRADSTFDADEVSILSQDGFYAGGLMTYVNLSSGPATDFQFYVHGTLPASTGVTLGTIAQVNLNGDETFFIHRAHGPLAQFLFNPSTLLPGQHITVGGPASGATNEQTLTVKRVTLRQRGYNATVVSGSVNPGTQTFQIQVNDFAGLLIPQTVTVYVESNTAFRGGLYSITDLQSDATVRVVGLLIKDPTSGNTVLLARYVDELD